MGYSTGCDLHGGKIAMAVSCINFEFPCLPNVACAFQKRSISADPLAGNISYKVEDDPGQVLERRKALMDNLRELGLACWSECQQVHGINVLTDPAPTPLATRPSNLPEADGMMTDEAGMGLVIKTADCQPILLSHKSGKFIMALHVGWRGNRAEFPLLAMEKFCSHYGILARDIFAVRGPSLGPSRAEFINFSHEWGKDFKEWYCESSKCLDLWSLSRAQLQKAGVPGQRIFEIDICTNLNSGEFFSYRRNRETGRQANIIWIKK